MSATRASLQHPPRVRAVCTRLRTVIAQLPRLHSVLFLPGNVGIDGLPAVISSVQKYNMYLHTLVADCSPIAEQAIVSLLACHCPISTAYIAHTKSADKLKTTITLLGSFSSLTACMLNMHEDTDSPHDSISLAPLRGLHHLALLDLSCGDFTDVDAAMHLTALKLDDCEASCAGDSLMVSSLAKLQISGSGLTGLHPYGVSACSALMSLDCKEAFIPANDQREVLYMMDDGYEESQFPASMPSLTALTNLICAARWGADTLHIRWWNRLPSLRSISICMDAEQVDVSCSFSCLTNLSNLEVSNLYHPQENKLHFGSCLADLVALETLSLHGQLTFGPATLNIVALQRLSKVSLSGFAQCSRETLLQVITLSSQLAAHRPKVSFLVEGQQFQ